MQDGSILELFDHSLKNWRLRCDNNLMSLPIHIWGQYKYINVSPDGHFPILWNNIPFTGSMNYGKVAEFARNKRTRRDEVLAKVFPLSQTRDAELTS